jgi:PhnB protein
MGDKFEPPCYPYSSLDITAQEDRSMAVKPIPEGYHTVTPYLVVKGVDKLIQFLTQAFDAKELHRTVGPGGAIAHAEVKIGDSPVMMGEAGGPFPAMPAAIYLYVKDVDATYKRAIQAGAAAAREPANQFYGDRSGGVTDPFGNQWWIATHVEVVPPEEMKKRADEAMKERAAP